MKKTILLCAALAAMACASAFASNAVETLGPTLTVYKTSAVGATAMPLATPTPAQAVKATSAIQVQEKDINWGRYEALAAVKATSAIQVQEKDINWGRYEALAARWDLMKPSPVRAHSPRQRPASAVQTPKSNDPEQPERPKPA